MMELWVWTKDLWEEGKHLLKAAQSLQCTRKCKLK